MSSRVWRILSALTFAVGGLPAAHAQLPDARGALSACIISTAKRLAKGPDAADLIAKTAIQFCQTEFSAYLNTLPDSIEKMAVRQALLDQFQKEAETKALTAILDLRAK